MTGLGRNRVNPDRQDWLKPNSILSSLHRSGLTLLVHFDAFRSDPAGYVRAGLWRARGLKVRSRNRLAALMGRSPRAYLLWIARTEPKLQAELLKAADDRAPRIVLVIDCSNGCDPVATRASIPSEAECILVGGEQVPGYDRVERPEDLSALIDSLETWLCVVAAGDVLAPHALEIYKRAAAGASDHWVIYSDDDLLGSGGRRNPHFKGSWNPDLYEHHDFITGSAIIRVSREMLADLPARAWSSALVDRALERGPPCHLAAVLHHRGARPAPIVPSKPQPMPAPAGLVSVIVPTRNQSTLLRTCVEGVRATAYPSIELIIIDNGSDEPDALGYLEKLRSEGATVLTSPGPFNFSALNNTAVKHAKGDMLCFLNNDVEILDRDWLSLLVGQACRREIGAVGGRLLYPDGSVQHAGVVTGVGGGAAHAHRMLTSDEKGYFQRDQLPQLVSAVTAACMVVAKKKFLAVDGFNATDFPVAFNDVDLCLKLNSRGWQTFYEPRAVMVHHESKSRGSDSAKANRDRFAAELSALKRIWGTDRIRDPYHHPQLSPFCEQFTIAL